MKVKKSTYKLIESIVKHSIKLVLLFLSGINAGARSP